MSSALLSLSILLFVLGGQPPFAEPEQAKKPIHLTVVGTNDLHGWIFPHQAKGPRGAQLGGVATFAGYLNILRSLNPNGTLLLDAGDLFQGTLASNLTEGQVVIDAMNRLGYAASAIGNHEFDYGPVGPASVALNPGQDPFGVLKARIQQAKFPLLAANLYDAKTGRRPPWLLNDGTLLLEVSGLKVGIIGLITPTTPEVTNPLNVASLRFGSVVSEAISASQKLRQRGAAVVIGVTHLGGKCARWKNSRDLSTCDLNGEIFKLLQGVPEGTLDAVVAGHTHAPLGLFVHGTPVIESWGMGQYFGIIDLYVDSSSHKIIADGTTIHPAIAICAQMDALTGSCEPKTPSPQWVSATFAGREVKPDAQLQQQVAAALSRVEAQQHRSLGVWVPRKLTRSYESESALGDVVTDALREMEQADVALFNGGGLRADLPAGELTYGALYETSPFDNGIATLLLSGTELAELLQAAYGGKKGVFQESGLRLSLSKCPGQGRLKSFVLADGQSIVPNRQYKVVLPDFLARGGDGLGPFMASLPSQRVDMGERRPFGLRDSLGNFWRQKKSSLIAPERGRLGFVEDGSSCNPGATMDPQAAPR